MLSCVIEVTKKHDVVAAKIDEVRSSDLQYQFCNC